jgi:hypothetical protein
MAIFYTLTRNLYGGSKEIHVKPQDSRCRGRDLNRALFDYEPFETVTNGDRVQ